MTSSLIILLHWSLFNETGPWRSKNFTPHYEGSFLHLKLLSLIMTPEGKSNLRSCRCAKVIFLSVASALAQLCCISWTVNFLLKVAKNILERSVKTLPALFWEAVPCCWDQSYFALEAWVDTKNSRLVSLKSFWDNNYVKWQCWCQQNKGFCSCIKPSPEENIRTQQDVYTPLIKLLKR